MSSPGYTNPKRLSVLIPTTPTTPSTTSIRSREPSLEPRSRSNSVARRNSIDTQARSFAENCEELANRHKTDKTQVIVDVIFKILEKFVKK